MKLKGTHLEICVVYEIERKEVKEEGRKEKMNELESDGMEDLLIWLLYFTADVGVWMQASIELKELNSAETHHCHVLMFCFPQSFTLCQPL